MNSESPTALVALVQWHSAEPNLDPKSYSIRPIDGKGMGIVARKPIASGKLILSERPLFTQPLLRGLPTILKALSPKTTTEKKQFLELTNCHVGSKHPFVGIFDSNAFPCGEKGVATKAGLFLQGARFNSSCVPNTNSFWNDEKGVMEFWAIRDIKKGEELCIWYNMGFDKRKDRVATLQRKFGFQCRCAACSLTGDELKASDDRRAALGELKDALALYGSHPAAGLKKVCQNRRYHGNHYLF